MKLKISYLLITVIITLSLLLSGCALLPAEETPSDPSTPSVTTPIDPGWTPPAANGQDGAMPSIADVVEIVNPSVVAINTEYVSYDIFNRPYEEQGAGSGWIIDEDGLIVTNNHVVEGAQSVTVTLADGSTYNATTIRTDPLSDLAIVKVNASNLPAAKVGDSADLRVGDWVIAIGNSLGMGISATKGIVSAQGVSLLVSEGQTLNDLIQTDAAINPGNSGGPLVNMAGEVIGITSVKVAQVGVEGMGYAISSDSAVPIIEELIQNGYVVRPWLGAEPYTVNQYVVMRYDLAVDVGALIIQVVVDSPADNADIQPGDIVVSIDGEPITSAEEFNRVIYSKEVGQLIEIGYWRGESQGTVYVTLEETPPPS
ncbi:MAG: trypsin-like peptidase domain-containing protein [Dehalococcoidia bacterium]|jgi:serine protease Do